MLAYSTSSHAVRVTDRIARVAAAGRIEREREAREAASLAEWKRDRARADQITAELLAEYGLDAAFGVKVCDIDAKWRATDATAEWVGWLLATVADVEFWPMIDRA